MLYPRKRVYFLVNTLLLYIPLLTLTDRITDGETHTLASRGLEELFLQLCCCVSFLFWRKIGFGFTYYLCTQGTIQLWCCVSFFGSGEGIVFGVTYVLSVQYSCVVVSVFWCGGKVNFVQIPYSHDRFSKISRTFFVRKLIPYETYVREDQLFLALYGSTTIQSQLFLKKYRKLCLIS